MKWFRLFGEVGRAVRPRLAYDGEPRRRGIPLSGCGGRVLIALVIAGFAIVQYYMSTTEEVNPFTGRTQRLELDPQEEIQLGLASFKQMASMHGGLSSDTQAASTVKQVGQKLVQASDADETVYKFDFHLLADRRTVNAFALPGGQIFITEALLRLLKSEDELAGVLGHEIGHVVGRHSSEQIAKNKRNNGITMGVVVATSDGQSGGSAQLAQLINQAVNTSYSRDDERESDRLGVKFLIQAGYKPEALIRVMDVLRQASGGGGGGPDFLSTHPAPENRIELIKAEIEKQRKGEG
jgi:predicted Zn-dependent protease